jgi:DNA-directed RNA polymerase alpha subunit
MKINVEFSSLSDMANFTKFINDSLVPPTQKQVSVSGLGKRLESLTEDNKRLEELLDRAYTRLRMADPKGETANKQAEEGSKLLKEVLAKSIDALELTARSRNCLHSEGIYTIGQLVAKTENEIWAIANLGNKSRKEIKEELFNRFKLTLKQPK